MTITCMISYKAVSFTVTDINDRYFWYGRGDWYLFQTFDNTMGILFPNCNLYLIKCAE